MSGYNEVIEQIENSNCFLPVTLEDFAETELAKKVKQTLRFGKIYLIPGTDVMITLANLGDYNSGSGKYFWGKVSKRDEAGKIVAVRTFYNFEILLDECPDEISGELIFFIELFQNN